RKYNPKKIQEQVNPKIKKIREKIKSVASELSVSHFERVRTKPQGEGAPHQKGTVFQQPFFS
ncbi:MAG: hypothetical protein PUK36_03610, partial [Prevotella sp.]|nr:hypothetical protein [Prevotella sp.]